MGHLLHWAASNTPLSATFKPEAMQNLAVETVVSHARGGVSWAGVHLREDDSSGRRGAFASILRFNWVCLAK